MMEVETIKKFNDDIDTLCIMFAQIGEKLKSFKLTVNEVRLDSLKSSPSCTKCNAGGDSTLKQLEKVSSKLENLAKSAKVVNGNDEVNGEDEVNLANDVDGCSSEASTVIEVATRNIAKKADEVEEFVDAEAGGDSSASQSEQIVKPELLRIPVTPEYIKPPVNYLEVEHDRFVPVTLSGVHSSRNFYVSRKTDTNRLAEFYQQLNDFYYAEDLEKFKVMGFKKKQLYVYFYDTDQSYYRVMVVDFLSNNLLKFIFIDIGTESTGVLKDFYKLDPKFDDKHTPVFALPCFVQAFQIYDSALEKMQQETNEFKVKEIKVKFSEPLQNGYLPVSLKVEMPDGFYSLHDYEFNCDMNEKYIDAFFEVQSFLSDNNIVYDKEMVANAYEKFNERYPFPQQAVEVFDPVCLKVIDISNFVCTFNVIRAEDGWELANFTNNITLFYEHMQSLDGPIGVEQLVVFKLDKYFIRGYILSTSVRDVYNVFAFDFGFVISLTKTVLYPMFDIFSPDLVPPFAILCCLDNAEPIKDNWSTIAIKQFQNYVKENFLMTINRTIKGKFYVNVNDGIKDIVNVLKRQKFAK